MRKITGLTGLTVLLVMLMVLPVFAADTWKQEGEDWYCYDSSGNLYKGTWCRNGVFYYYTDETTGAIVKNRLIDDGQYKYYCGSDGIRVTDKLQKVELPDRPDGYEWMYFQPTSGRAATGLTTVSSKRYIFDENGYMLYGFLTEDLEPAEYVSEAYWYMGKRDEGSGYSGWLHLKEEDDINYPGESSLWFYFDKGKKAVSTTVTKNGYKYVLDEHGAMLHGWVKDAGTENWKYYGTVDDGVLKRSCWVKSDFDFTTQEYDGETYWYYLDSSGLRKGLSSTEFVNKIDGKFYLFSEGHMNTGLIIGTALEGDFTDQANFIPDKDMTAQYASDLESFKAMPRAGDDGNRYAVMYFSGENDGSMKTGSQQVDFEGETATLYFDKHGYAVEGIYKDRIYQNGILQKPEDSRLAIKELRLGNDIYPTGWYLVSSSGTLLFASASLDEDSNYWAATKKPADALDTSYCIYKIPAGVTASGAANLLKASNNTEEEWSADGLYYRQLQSGGKYYDIYRSESSDGHYYDVTVSEAEKR